MSPRSLPGSPPAPANARHWPAPKRVRYSRHFFQCGGHGSGRFGLRLGTATHPLCCRTQGAGGFCHVFRTGTNLADRLTQRFAGGLDALHQAGNFVRTDRCQVDHHVPLSHLFNFLQYQIDRIDNRTGNDHRRRCGKNAGQYQGNDHHQAGRSISLLDITHRLLVQPILNPDQAVDVITNLVLLLQRLNDLELFFGLEAVAPLQPLHQAVEKWSGRHAGFANSGQLIKLALPPVALLQKVFQRLHFLATAFASFENLLDRLVASLTVQNDRITHRDRLKIQRIAQLAGQIFLDIVDLDDSFKVFVDALHLHQANHRHHQHGHNHRNETKSQARPD